MHDIEEHKLSGREFYLLDCLTVCLQRIIMNEIVDIIYYPMADMS